MLDTQKYILNPDFKAERFDNEILLYASSSSKGVYLNETAYLVWQLCEKGLSVGEMIEVLEEEYSQQKAIIREDILLAIESLAESGALIEIDG